MSIKIVIGKNFGDEGKGLAVDYFASVSEKAGRSCLVIRHNGGGQAGHTVEMPGKRNVFSSLSSGTFRHADTYWSETFLPDPYSIMEELHGFASSYRFRPKIYASGNTCCVTVIDVLLNQGLEELRGDERHGSCGMGIDEAYRRSGTDYKLPLCKLIYLSGKELFDILRDIRDNYLPGRLDEIGISINDLGYYAGLICDDNVLKNWAYGAVMLKGLIELEESSIMRWYDDIVFEGAQGLLLDSENIEYAPHLTSSRTGLVNPLNMIRSTLPSLEKDAEAVYVTRSYVTRHGNGPLPHEFESIWFPDQTNIPNEWQGTLRFADHGSYDEFMMPVKKDIESIDFKGTHSFFITHLNEMELPFIDRIKAPLYLSYDKYSENVRYQR